MRYLAAVAFRPPGTTNADNPPHVHRVAASLLALLIQRARSLALFNASKLAATRAVRRPVRFSMNPARTFRAAK